MKRTLVILMLVLMTIPVLGDTPSTVSRAEVSTAAGADKPPAVKTCTHYFFDEWGQGEEKIPAILKKCRINVISVENNDNVTSVTYAGQEDLIKEKKTVGEFGPSDGAKIAKEVKKIVKELKAAGKKIIWTGRWGDMIDGATVYYLD